MRIVHVVTNVHFATFVQDHYKLIRKDHMAAINQGLNTIHKLYALLALVVVLVMSIWLYLPVLDYTWLVGPDQEFVQNNEALADLDANNLWDVFLTDVNGRYQPLSMLSYAMDDLIFPNEKARGHHLINLILHLLNILLLFRIVKLLSRSGIAAISAALLLAIHPMNVESVSWIFSRSVLLAVFFFLMGMLFYLYYLRQENNKKALLFFMGICFMGALLSNPIGIVFPIAIVLIDYSQDKSIRSPVNGKIPLFILSTIFLFVSVIISSSISGDPMNTVPGAFEWVLLKIYALSALLFKFFVPIGHAGFYPFPEAGILQVIAAVGLLLLIPTVFILFRKSRILKACLLFFFFGGSLTLLLATHSPALYREQDAYMPYLSLYILMGLATNKLILWARGKQIVYSAMAALVMMAFLIFLTTISANRVEAYSSSEKYWNEVIDAYPEAEHAYFMRGNYWAMRGENEKAKFDYSQCVRNNENAYEAITYLGLIYMQQGTPHDAIAEFSKAILIKRDFYKAYLNRGLAYMTLGKDEEALLDMNKSVELNSSDSRVYYNRGLVYERLNALPDAIADFSRAIRIDPHIYIYYKDRGKAYVWMSEFAYAELDYSKAIEINDRIPEMWFRRSLVRSSLNKFREGLEDALMAKNLGFEVDEEYIKGLTLQVLKTDSVFSE